MLSGQRSTRGPEGDTRAEPRVREAYLAATAGSRPRDAAPPPAPPQRPVEGECSICFDDLKVSGRPRARGGLVKIRHLLCHTAYSSGSAAL